MTLWQAFSRFFGPKRARPKTTRFQLYPRLERLEDRTVPSQTAWTDASGSHVWSTPSNWTVGAPPTSGDYVYFDPAYTTDASVVDRGYTVDRVNFVGGAGALWIPTDNPLPRLDATPNYFNHVGTLIIDINRTISTTDYYLTNGEIRVGGPFTINAGNAFVDGGTIHVFSGGILQINTNAFQELPFKDIIVDAGGILLVNANFQLIISGTIRNAGVVSLTSPLIKFESSARLIGTAGMSLNVPASFPPGPIALSATSFVDERGLVIIGPVPSVPAAVAMILAGATPSETGSPTQGDKKPGFVLVGGLILAEAGSEIDMQEGTELTATTDDFKLKGSLRLTNATATITGPLHMDGGDVTMTCNNTSFPTSLTVTQFIHAQTGADLIMSNSTLSVTGDVDMDDPTMPANSLSATNTDITVGGTFGMPASTTINNVEHTITVGGNWLQNGGTVTVEVAGGIPPAVSVGGDYSQAAGTINLSNSTTLQVGGSAGIAGTMNLHGHQNGVTARSFTLIGMLNCDALAPGGPGPSWIDADVVNQGSIVISGPSAGLGIERSYTQTINGSLTLSHYDGFSVLGSASLDGTLNLTSAPTTAETIANFSGGLSGDFRWKYLPPGVIMYYRADPQFPWVIWLWIEPQN